MEVETKQERQAAIIRAKGDIDLYTSPKLREAILEGVKKQLSPIVVNLTQVTYMDSSGVATLIEAFQLSKAYGGVVRLVGVNERVSEVFKLVRLQQVFKTCQTETEAIENQPEH
jgi:anti-sigma B factor antagonist